MEKKPTVSVTYENERISIKNSLPYLKCVLRLSCVVHGPNYGRFYIGFFPIQMLIFRACGFDGAKCPRNRTTNKKNSSFELKMG